MASSYTSNDIQTLQFPENIRAVPGMYIGAVDADGYWLILRECLDNGLDEYLAGRNKGVALVEDQDGSFWIYDQGAGIPQGTKILNLHVNGKLVQSKMPTMQAIFSQLHTSGKYHSEAYKVSVGTHGIGVKASNALSEYFEVFTRFKNQWYAIGFKKGNLSQPVKACAAPKFLGKTLLKGTLIHLKHDKSIFKKDVRLDFEKAKSWAEITSYLNPGFSVIIKDKEGNSFKYVSKEGPKEFVTKTLEKLKAQAEPEVFEFKNELADVLVSFSNAEGNNIHGYTNGLFNSDGGKHVDSVSSALYLACKQFAKAKQTVSAYDFKEGLVGIVNMHLHKAEFSSQDKLKLTDNRAGADFQKMLETAATTFFKKNKVLAQKLCEKASKLSELRSQFKASKKMISAINAAKKKGMPAKYAPYSANSKLEDRELLIVEGLSAAGGLRQVRNSNQALYPIKGKITNLIKNKDKGLESEEVINILSAIGYDPKAENPMSKLQVGRVICLADADDDGYHINTLLLSLFYKVLPEMFEKGMIYVADMPEFYTTYKNTIITGQSISEIKTKLLELGHKPTANDTYYHLKGWGELENSLMKVLAVDKATRKLIRIKPITDHDNVTFVRIMNEDVAYRRQMLGLSDDV
jgi:DNA gyrase subunit B